MADAMAYIRAKNFLDTLKKCAVLTSQERSTLKGQALHGDIDGAIKGLERILRRRA